MATIIDEKITIQFAGDVENALIDLSEDGDEIWIEQDCTTIVIPRAELEQFCAILRNWNAEHPRQEGK